MDILIVSQESRINVTIQAPPEAIYSLVEALRKAGKIDVLARRPVDITADAAQVAAFVYAAKPWLRSFSINGVAVATAPTVPPDEIEVEAPAPIAEKQQSTTISARLRGPRRSL